MSVGEMVFSTRLMPDVFASPVMQYGDGSVVALENKGRSEPARAIAPEVHVVAGVISSKCRTLSGAYR